MLTRLLAYAIMEGEKRGVEVVVSYTYRSPEEQRRMVAKGASMTMNSLHCQKLAVDLILFRGNQPLWNTSEYLWLGEYWESIGGVWGGRWKKPVDGGHFQYAGEKRKSK